MAVHLFKTLHDYGLKNTFKFGIDLMKYKTDRMFISKYGKELFNNFSLASKDINSLDSAFDFVMAWKFKRVSIRPLQNKKEFLDLLILFLKISASRKML